MDTLRFRVHELEQIYRLADGASLTIKGHHVDEQGQAHDVGILFECKKVAPGTVDFKIHATHHESVAAGAEAEPPPPERAPRSRRPSSKSDVGADG